MTEAFDRTSLPGSNKSPSFKVVGIGASAGGLESLEQLFSNLPADTGMAFVIIQHLSPDFRSMMDELLSRHSDMPVRLAEHDVEVQPNSVYLLPPKKEMIIRGRRLLLSDKDPGHTLHLPIDLFFRSLADGLGSDAIGIVLSGTGSDGSRGIRAIKGAGGVVIVESPETAKFDGMPLSALATGAADHTLPAKEIPLVLNGQSVQSGLRQTELSEAESPMQALHRLMRDNFHLDLSSYKSSTVERRIARRASLLNLPGLQAYVEQLQNDPKELSSLYHDLLIGVTRFFRDPEAFEVIETKVVPELLDRVHPSEEIRVWVAGCATGEEAYSLAMLLYEQLSRKERPINAKILATDMHRASLEAAGLGLYEEAQLVHVSEERRARFFRKRPNGFQISQDLRQLIVFAPHDVTRDAPFTKMHLISCRNLLIYFETPAQKTVLSLFHFGLCPGGYLLLGASESTGTLANEFAVVDEHWKVFKKRRDVRLLEPATIPLGRSARRPGRSGLTASVQLGESERRPLATYDQLLDRFMPPSFLIDEDRNLLDSFGGAERFLRLGRRRPSTNLLDLLQGELRTVVAGLIQRALKTQGRVRYTGVPLRTGDSVERGSISADIITNTRTGATHVLVCLEPTDTPGESDTTAAAADAPDMVISGGSQERMDVLESELAYTRETLQATIEELQTSNEELQATNEELVASNEELQSTNEELHSVNEELYTVNAEYQKKILELRELNNDIQHLLESTDVGTLFLDAELCIRKYTPRIANIFHIQPQDIGRYVRDFTYNLKRPTLIDDLEQALKNGQVMEAETRDVQGTPYFLRILPYRGLEVVDPDATQRIVRPTSSIEGVVLTLTDISALDQARSNVAQLSAIVASSDDAIIGKTLDGTITSWNRGAERLYGFSEEEAVGRNIRMLVPPERQQEIGNFLEEIAKGGQVEQAETLRIKKDGSCIDVSVTISPIYDGGSNIVGASAIARDVTQLKQAQRTIEQREERIRLLLESTAEAIFGLDTNGLCTFCNPACIRFLGYSSAEEIIGKNIHALIHQKKSDGSPYSEADCPIYGVLRTGQGAHSDEEVLWRADGTSFPAEYWSHPVRNNGQIVGAVVTFVDVTSRKQAEDEIRTAARRREQFLAMLSHELRNPLAAVLNATKLMAVADTDTMAKARRVIDRQSQHMARLLDDLLDMARITRGGFTLKNELFDFRQAIWMAIEALTPYLEERQARLNVDLPEHSLLVSGDPARLQQVVANLLSNAARYSPKDEEIHLTGRVDSDMVVLSLGDHGVGIASDMLPLIFDLFVQTDRGLDRSQGGLGVGLTLVKKIVELHGGTVHATSDGPGTGSTFTVRLPREKQDPMPESEKQNSEKPARRILLVEDQDDAREMLRMLLEVMGNTVSEAKDGISALEAMERDRPDVALIDIGLPTMSGYEVARKARENPKLGNITLVALTGYGAQEDVRAAREAGFDEHITKPADPAKLERVLANR